MMRFANDIRRLSQSLAEAQENRVSALEKINRQTAQQLNTFRSDRATMSTQQRREFAENTTGLRNTVRAMQENTAALLGEIETARENMAQVQTQELQEHTEAVRNAARQLRNDAEGFVATVGQSRQKSATRQAKHLNQEATKLRSNVGDFRKSINTAQDAMATRQREQLNAALETIQNEVAGLRAATAEILKGFEAEFAQMATEQDAELKQDMQTLQARVTELRENAAQFVADADIAHQEAAAALRQDLLGHHTDLETTVANIRVQFRAEHDNIRKDHAEARLIWTRLNTLLQHRRAKQMGQSEPPAPVKRAVHKKAPVSPPPVEEPVAPTAPPATTVASQDDLTLIHGIGQATQHRLNEAGVLTFAQLAAADEEQLRQAIGQVGRIAKVDEWITLAREMTG